jgi:hypothetical protein
LAIFEKIANLIDEHNEKFTNGEVLFSMDLNPYSAAVRLFLNRDFIKKFAMI